MEGVFGSIDDKNETVDHELELRTKGLSDVYVTLDAIAVGGHSGWRTYPGAQPGHRDRRVDHGL